MNNTLEGISSRVTEAEEQISDLKDRMVEINAAKQNTGKKKKKKERNEMKTAPKTAGTTLNAPIFTL